LSPDCIFCVLLNNSEPAKWLVRTPLAAAFLTRPEDALAPGHTLVIPVEHAIGVQDVSAQSLSAAIELTQRVAQGIQRSLGGAGVNILNASGPGSDQSVPHLHFHVVPRWPDDGLDTWPATRSQKRLNFEPSQALTEEFRNTG
jgi:histidine triad (HIT) family protein